MDMQPIWMAVPILFVVLVTAVVKWLAVVAAVVVGIRISERWPRRTTYDCERA